MMQDDERSIEDTGIAFQDAVCAPTNKGPTLAQRTFLGFMAQDWPAPSSVAEITKRAGKSRSWTFKYRESLLQAQVIEPAGEGLVAYAIPYFGEFMTRHMEQH